MRKFFKKALVFGGVALAAHFGFKAYKRFSGVAKLAKSLPEFLNNIYGERPKLDVNQSLNMLNIKVGFTPEILEKHEDIETTVREYIDDFHPEMARGAINIEVVALMEDDEGEEPFEDEEMEEEAPIQEQEED